MSFETQQRKFVRPVRVQPEGMRGVFTGVILLARQRARSRLQDICVGHVTPILPACELVGVAVHRQRKWLRVGLCAALGKVD